MATQDYNIEIKVSSQNAVRDTDAATKSLNQLDKAAKNVANSSNILSRALSIVAGAFAIDKIKKAADTYTEMRNKLKALGGETSNYVFLQQQLYDIAQRSRTSIAGTTQLYSRLMIAQGQLGASTKELLTFTEGIGKALQISGTSAFAQRGVLLQLSQAMGTNVVRAEEFNSILEGGIRIAQAAADGMEGMGGSVAKLRKAVVDGKVSSEEFFRAILSQIPKLEEEFAKTIPTIDQAFTQLNNAFIKFIGSANDATGISQLIAKAIRSVAENMEATAIAVGVFTIAVSTTLAKLKAPAFLAMIPYFKAIAIAIGLATLAYKLFAKEVSAEERVLRQSKATMAEIDKLLKDQIVWKKQDRDLALEQAKAYDEALDKQIEALEKAKESLSVDDFDFWDALTTNALGAWDKLVDSLNAAFIRIKAKFDWLKEQWDELMSSLSIPEWMKETGRAISKGAGALSGYLTPAVGLANTVNDLGTATEATVELKKAEIDREIANAKLEKTLNGKRQEDLKNVETMDASKKTIGELSEEEGKRLKKLTSINEQLEHQRKLMNLVSGEQKIYSKLQKAGFSADQIQISSGKVSGTSVNNDKAQDIINKQRAANIQAVINKLNEEEQQLGKTNIQKKVYNTLVQAGIPVTYEDITATGQLTDAYASANPVAAELADRIQAINEKAEKTPEKIKGYKEVISDWAEQTTNVSYQFGQVFTSALDDATDRIIDFCKTGQFSFADFAASIVEDIARIIIKIGLMQMALIALNAIPGGQGVAAALDAGASKNGGGLLGGIGGLFGFADGGYISGPGSGTSDSIPARLSNGEFVVNAKSTERYRGVLEAINNNRFAKGGYVGSGSSGSGDVSVNVIDQRGSNTAPIQTSTSTGPDGKKMIQVLVRDAVKKGFSNGSFDGSMQMSYGLRRVAR
ncbi:MAG: tape measure protein [Clostridium sp.]|nr:tape measure protein [Clostridium sp.]